MTDELDLLRAAMTKATPQPDPAKRAENLRAAQENFQRRQESNNQMRPTSESHPIAGRFLNGVSQMFDAMTSRGGLVATTALVAVGLILVTPQGRSLFTLPSLSDSQPLATDPVPVPKPVQEIVSGERHNSEITPVEPEIARKRDDAALHDRDDVVIAGSVAPTSREQVMDEPMAFNELAETGVLADVASAPPQRHERNLGLEQDRSATRVAPMPEAVVSANEENTETFSNAAPNPLKITSEAPVSTFSVDVDTASYSVVRSSLRSGQLPPPDAVRIEEMVNYFPYDYAAPELGEAPFKPTVSLMATPWNDDTRLVHIALQGQMPAQEDRAALNLVFLIDTSGSMHNADKLPLLKQSFRLMLGQLRPQDQVAIVTYAGSAGQVLAPTAASERTKILAALDQLEAGGSTAGQAGLQQAYSLADSMAEDGEVTRVLLATDGDFNVGLSDPEALTDFIAKKRDSGTYLSVLGFGRGNLDDATMQALAQNGNGQASYIDTLNEAQKVLVDQLSGALFPIANDVKIQVEFNPATVAEYRLIGYETRALNREDFNNDAVDAGEIGAGHSVTALYEITPVGSPAVLSDPLRYQTQAESQPQSDELGFLRLRYKSPGKSNSALIETPITWQMAPASIDAQFTAAIAGFGQLLRGSDYVAGWSWGDAILLATQARGEDVFGYRAEAISLMRLAESLSQD